jgi:tetratricopeptide (TPR) repeat protein
MADPAALWQQGQQAIRAQRFDEARERFEQLLRLQPAHLGARLLLAAVHLAQGHARAAAQETLAAARALPSDAGAIVRVAQALRQLGETNAARAVLAHPYLAATRDPRALLAAAHVQQGLGEHAKALPLMDRALALGLDNPDMRYFRALQLQFHGRLAEAEAELERCLRMGPTYGRASVMLARLRRATPGRNQLDFIAQRLQQVERGSEDEAAFEFARYVELETLGRDEEAWTALARGNALMHARLQQSPVASFDEDALLRAIVGKATPDFLQPVADREPPASPEHPQPIFILGMPRSGTTLLESLLGRHSQVASAGELIEFGKLWRQVADVHGHAIADPALVDAPADFAEVGRRYLEQTRWRANGRAFYIDKLPPNFWLAGFIRKALPQARILHMAREPMELCFSNWRALFGDSYAYSYDIDALAAQHARYSKLMAHWHQAMPGAIHDVDYAALVADPEATLRRALAHLGLDFDERLLDATADAGPVATLSSAQVRAPVSDARRRDWQRYAAQLEPLRAKLAAQ